MTERCGPPTCVRVLGHVGPCSSHWWIVETCGVTTPHVRECARMKGHRGLHMSRRSMDAATERKARFMRATA